PAAAYFRCAGTPQPARRSMTDAREAWDNNGRPTETSRARGVVPRIRREDRQSVDLGIAAAHGRGPRTGSRPARAAAPAGRRGISADSRVRPAPVGKILELVEPRGIAPREAKQRETRRTLTRSKTSSDG